MYLLSERDLALASSPSCLEDLPPLPSLTLWLLGSREDQSSHTTLQPAASSEEDPAGSVGGCGAWNPTSGGHGGQGLCQAV